MYIKEISKKVKIQFTALKAEQNFLHERYQGGGIRVKIGPISRGENDIQAAKKTNQPAKSSSSRRNSSPAVRIGVQSVE